MHANFPPFGARHYREVERLGAGTPHHPGAGTPMHDPVTKPAHYQRGGIETIDYIRATLGDEGYASYCLGNVLKYVSRYRDKDGVQDLKKAQVYLEWAIAAQERNS